MEFNLDLAEGAFRLESEVAGCEVTRDNRANLVPNDTIPKWLWSLVGSETIPGWVMRTFKPRYTSSFDFAFKMKPVVKMYDARLYGKLDYVGPGFKSLGAPGLRNDNFALGAGIERSFFDNAVSLSASYSSENDNLLRQKVSWVDTIVVGPDTDYVPHARVLTLKSSTTRFENWEANLGVTFPNLPYLQVGYYPYTQATDELDSLANVVSTSSTMGNVVSVSAGHSFQAGKVSHSPSVTVSYNDVKGTDSTANSTSWDAGANYGLGFESPLSFSAGAGYSRSVATGTDPDTRVYADVTPSYTFFEKWSNSLTLGGTFGSATRIDLRYSSSFPVWKICDGRVGISDAIYSGDDGKYNDLRVTAELSRSW